MHWACMGPGLNEQLCPHGQHILTNCVSHTVIYGTELRPPSKVTNTHSLVCIVSQVNT